MKHLVTIPGFKKAEFSCNSKLLCQTGYKFIETKDGSDQYGLLIFCRLNHSFVNKLTNAETLEALDRLMKVQSNLVPPLNIFYLSPSEFLTKLMKDKDYDFFQIDDLLEG